MIVHRENSFLAGWLAGWLAGSANLAWAGWLVGLDWLVGWLPLAIKGKQRAGEKLGNPLYGIQGFPLEIKGKQGRAHKHYGGGVTASRLSGTTTFVGSPHPTDTAPH